MHPHSDDHQGRTSHTVEGIDHNRPTALRRFASHG